ncbi:MAG TPA: sulfite exporter TauE/SafE family protein [Thermoanaerobaculia bacterium]|nr:sulfite exporter TauE/SafE family protein [Thermoanaerobaculia bacterium]
MIDLLIGVMAGFFIGATGIGAGSILTPLLILRGYDPVTAVTTGFIALIAARKVGSVQHILSGHWPKRGGLRVLFAGVAGGGIGFLLVHHFITRTLLFESALRLALAVVLLTIGVAGFFSLHLQPRPHFATVAAAGAGAIVSATSAGSGTLLGALVFPGTDWRVHEFSAVSNLFGLCTGVIGIAAYMRLDRFDPALLGFVTAGSILGITAGVFASRRIERTHFALALRVLTIVLGAALAISWFMA